jgi:hypothetical protein
LAAAGISAPATADSNVFVAVGYTDQVVVLVEMTTSLQQPRRKTRATQFAYYASPDFSFEGVPIRLTETEFEIDCENSQSRRLRSAAYREIGDRVGNETYSEPWAPMTRGDAMDITRRLVCEGLGPDDVAYDNLNTAVGGLAGLLRNAPAD